MDLYPVLVSKAVEEVRKHKADVVILVPPGNSRIEVARRAAEAGRSVISYKDGGAGWRVVGDQFVEEALRIIKEQEGKWLVVPPDTTTANLLYAALNKKIETEVVYLPEVYKENLQIYEKSLPKGLKELEEVAEISHVVKGGERKGVSLKLLRLDEKAVEEVKEEARAAVDKIRALSPERTGVKDLAGAIASALPAAFTSALSGAAGAFLIASISASIPALIQAGASAIEALGASVKDFVEDFAKRLGVKLVEEPLKKAVDGVIAKIARKDERAKFLHSLAGLVKAAVEAKKYVDDERYESVVDEVASKWGLDVETFKTFVGNLARLAAGKVVTEEELERRLEELRGDVRKLEKRVEELAGEIDAKLDALWKEVEELRNEFRNEFAKIRLGRAGAYWLEDFEKGDVYSNIFVKDGRLKTRTPDYETRDVVATGAFLEAVKKISSALDERGFVVVVGPKGVGKSTAVAWLIWRWMEGGRANPLLKMDEVGGDGRKEEERRYGLLNFLELKCGEYQPVCASPLILYDPSPPSAYTRPETLEAARGVEQDLDFLKKVFDKIKVKVLAVLPRDLLTDEARKKYREYVVEVDLRNEEFIAALLREYSKDEKGEPCPIPDDAAGKIADEILKLDEGYALIARLVGEELRRRGCKAEDVGELLREAGGNALAFIAHYVNKTLGVVRDSEIDPTRAEKLAPLLRVRAYLSSDLRPGDYVMPMEFVKRWFGWEGLPYNEHLARWLAAKHHSLIEEALERAAFVEGIACFGDLPEGLKKALEPWRLHGGQREDPEKELEKYLTRYEESIRGDIKGELSECWRRFALMVGAALTGYPFRVLAVEVDESAKMGVDLLEGVKKAAEPCGVDRLFLEGGELTPFSEELLKRGGDAYKAYAGVKGIEEEVADLEKLWRKRGGWYKPVETVYAVGLSALLANAGRGLDGKTAEAALWLSAVGVQSVTIPDAVDWVVNILKPLSQWSREGWALLLHNAVAIRLTGKVYEELNKIYYYVEGGEDWLKAIMAESYAKAADMRERDENVNKACRLLFGIQDNLLKTVAEAYVYHHLYPDCPGVDICARLEGILGELKKWIGQDADELFRDHPQLREYAQRHSVSPKVGELLRTARGFALLSYARCVSDQGGFKKAKKHLEEAADIFSELKDWVNYLRAKGKAISTAWLDARDEKFAEVDVEKFEKLWEEALEKMELTAPYLEFTAFILGGYLIALALVGERERAEKLIEEYGRLLGFNDELNAAVRYALKYLGVAVDMPSDGEVLEAIRWEVAPRLLPVLAEILGAPVEGASNITIECKKRGNKAFCVVSYMRGRDVKTMELKIEGVSQDVLEKAEPRQLVEAVAPEASSARFILLARALANGDLLLARLHAEWGRVALKEWFLGRLFGDLADALAKGDVEAVKRALAKLYYFHF